MQTERQVMHRGIKHVLYCLKIAWHIELFLFFFFIKIPNFRRKKKGKLKKNESLLTQQLLMQHILFKGNLSYGGRLDNSNCFYLSIRIFYEVVMKKEENTRTEKSMLYLP